MQIKSLSLKNNTFISIFTLTLDVCLLATLVSQFSWQLPAKIICRALIRDLCSALAIEVQIMESI